MMIVRMIKFIPILLLLIFENLTATSQPELPKGLSLEKEAVIYFCQNLNSIDKGLTDYNIRFNNYTNGVKSRIFDVADCEGDINLIKNLIPNRSYLDSLDCDSRSEVEKRQKILVDCKFLKKTIFAPFNKRIYTLYVFNAVEYKE
ncbi:MAG TPA: hypothetical protein VMV56_02840, partial [Williamwhitmania sp.]|nr:hypothetical protein [Williamwhitmania sp.]